MVSQNTLKMGFVDLRHLLINPQIYSDQLLTEKSKVKRQKKDEYFF